MLKHVLTFPVWAKRYRGRKEVGLVGLQQDLFRRHRVVLRQKLQLLEKSINII